MPLWQSLLPGVSKYPCKHWVHDLSAVQCMLKQQGRQVRLAREPAPFFTNAFSITVEAVVGKNDASHLCYFSFRMSVPNRLEVSFITASSVLQIPSAPSSQTSSQKSTEELHGGAASLSLGDTARSEQQACWRARPEPVAHVWMDIWDWQRDEVPENISVVCPCPILLMSCAGRHDTE